MKDVWFILINRGTDFENSCLFDTLRPKILGRIFITFFIQAGVVLYKNLHKN